MRVDTLKAQTFQYSRLAFLILMTFSAAYGEVIYKSDAYSYSVTLPQGWKQIPPAEIERLKKSFPPQAQHLVYDAGFRPDDGEDSFTRPYVLIQIIEGKGPKRLPTEAEFFNLINLLPNASSSEKIKTAVGAIKDLSAREYVQSFLEGLKNSKIQYDLPRRQFYYAVNSMEGQEDAEKYFSFGKFMPSGMLLQVLGYTSVTRFDRDVANFVVISNSVR